MCRYSFLHEIKGKDTLFLKISTNILSRFCPDYEKKQRFACHKSLLFSVLSGKRGANPRFSDTVPTTFCDFVIRCKWVNYIFHKRRFWLPFVSFLSQYKAIKTTDFQSVIEGFDAPFPIRKKRCIFFVVSQRTQNFVAKICCKNMHFLDSKS